MSIKIKYTEGGLGVRYGACDAVTGSDIFEDQKNTVNWIWDHPGQAKKGLMIGLLMQTKGNSNERAIYL